jgi:hypothetical protein
VQHEGTICRVASSGKVVPMESQREPLAAFWTGDALVLFGGEEYGCPDNVSCHRVVGPDTLDGWILAHP